MKETERPELTSAGGNECKLNETMAQADERGPGKTVTGKRKAFVILS